MIFWNMITTVIGAYPKPSYLKIPDWFKAEGGTDTQNPTGGYLEALNSLDKHKESYIEEYGFDTYNGIKSDIYYSMSSASR